MSNYRKLNAQPLSYVLAEFVFSSVMKMKDFIPDIQESLRGVYPELLISESQHVEFKPGNHSVNVQTSEQWAFLNADKSSMLSLNQNKLVFMTTKYDRFDSFYAACESAIDILIDQVSPSLLKRVGLRYGDLVDAVKEFETEDLVQPYLASPDALASLGDVVKHHTETVLRTTAGVLAVRSLSGNHNLPCFPDMLNTPLSIASPESKPTQRVLLDFDHFWESPNNDAVTFDKAVILEKLAKLHEGSRDAFWKVTTDVARDEAWS